MGAFYNYTANKKTQNELKYTISFITAAISILN